MGELRSGSREEQIVIARGVFSCSAVKEVGYSGAEDVRFLGMRTLCVTRGGSSGKEAKRKRYL